MFAIVLNRRDYREYDQVITLYTREHGRMDLLSRGVKKIVSKNTAHLEPFSLIQVESTPGKEYGYITKVYSIEYFSGIRSHLEKSLVAQYVVGVLVRLLQHNEADEQIFDLVQNFLFYLEKMDSSEHVAFFLDIFFLKFFSLLGFAPVTDRCVVSNTLFSEFKKDEDFGFYFAGGGIVTNSIMEEKKKVGEQILLMNRPQLFLLKLFLEKGFSAFEFDFFDLKVATTLHKTVYEYVLYHNEYELRDWSRLNF
ncbi:MAG: DNA repair protein RecO [Candidatus Magasanikbacteria bacterium CG11_big_fil_rev_8_21_14_0_20_39_34]|uniref:DNA repair protein RecO n=1 Tax=Candidatus Magasanikbacteria bacterium CG11_big_fil_rev_8_21_14_0_20_39_34 TaxID=1974653 RepID=A0A2H0N645_9BACT|nr:MAG: DNA repair protein RecO [Candidatus Magasanikbacteria bacterium CG11_big_fil_rev_8_21_14_0_20_39_34]